MKAPAIKVLWVNWTADRREADWEPYLAIAKVEQYLTVNNPNHPRHIFQKIIDDFVSNGDWRREHFRILSYPKLPSMSMKDRIKIPSWWDK